MGDAASDRDDISNRDGSLRGLPSKRKLST